MDFQKHLSQTLVQLVKVAAKRRKLIEADIGNFTFWKAVLL